MRLVSALAVLLTGVQRWRIRDVALVRAALLGILRMLPRMVLWLRHAGADEARCGRRGGLVIPTYSTRPGSTGSRFRIFVARLLAIVAALSLQKSHRLISSIASRQLNGTVPFR
jgi:hypothetical protein